MFMFSFRLKKGRVLIAAALICAVVLISVMGGVTFFGGEAVAAIGNEAEEQPERPSRVRTNEQRLAYINSFGWQVEPEPVEIAEVIIPAQFDRLYEEYNALQKPAGHDLSRHTGRRAKRYTYVVTNYPGQGQDVRLNLLVRDNRVIGGDVYSMGPDGFMHGLAAPEQPMPVSN